MRPFRETVMPEAGASWAFLDRRLPGGIPFEWHHHPEYELTLTLNSEGHRYVGDAVDSYESGDLVLIGPGVPHSWCSRHSPEPGEPHVALVCWFSQHWADRLVATLPEMSDLARLLARAAHGLRFGADASARVAPLIEAMRTSSSTGRLLHLLEVLAILLQDREASELNASLPAPALDMPADHRMARVLDHLHGHYMETVRVEHLAGIACLSPSAFHRMFRRHTRTTVVDYLVRLRIGRACSLLIGTSAAISTIAAEVGYTNLSLFNRQFRQARGMSPSKFRADIGYRP